MHTLICYVMTYQQHHVTMCVCVYIHTHIYIYIYIYIYIHIHNLYVWHSVRRTVYAHMWDVVQLIK